MKTIKVMSLVGLGIGGVGLLCLMAWDNYDNFESAVGWGMIVALYLIAFAIVGVVQANKKNQ